MSSQGHTGFFFATGKRMSENAESKKRHNLSPLFSTHRRSAACPAVGGEFAEGSAACPAVGGAFAEGNPRRSAFQRRFHKSHIPVTSLANSHHPRGASSTSHDSISIMESEVTRRSVRRADVHEFAGRSKGRAPSGCARICRAKQRARVERTCANLQGKTLSGCARLCRAKR